MCFSPQRRTIIRHQNVQKCSEDYSFLTFSLPNVLFATAACNYSTSERPKVLRRLQLFHMFTSKCAFRHSGVRFFDIGPSKSAPKTTVFLLFATAAYNFSTGEEQKVLRTWRVLYIFTCKCAFPPQPRTIFQHQNVPKWSKHVMFCTFWLANVLRATAACHFWTSQIPKSVRDCGVLRILTCKCAFRHSGVQFLISPLTTWLRTRRFNRPTFRLTWHTNHWKNTAFRDFSNISRACIFFLLTFWLLHLLSTDLTTLLLSYASAFELSYCWAMHLLFNCPYCRKFLFKLPSIITIKNLCYY